MRLPRISTSLALLVLSTTTAAGSLSATRSTASSAPPPTPDPGNVLIILADDLGLDWLGLYGVAPAPGKTPHLDALAAEGVTFQEAWSAPVCSPARALVQTGRYGFRSGIGGNVAPGLALPLSETTLPELLDLGSGGTVAHGFFGKWHLGDESVGAYLAPNVAGWDHFAGAVTHAGSTEPGQDYFMWTRVTNGVLEELEDAYVTTVNVDDALAWIDQQSEPWVACVALTSVHTPIHAPPAALHTVDLSGAGPPAEDPVPYMQAMLEAMDTEIGRLVAGVDAETTTVIFAADNGTIEPLALPPFDPLKSKNSLFQGGVRVPMIARGPHVTQPGSVCGALVHLTDLYTTAADLVGIDAAATLPPDHALDGLSLVPYLVDPNTASQRDVVFSEVFYPNGAHTGVLAQPAALPVCQPDVGFGGPGDASATMCGEPLVVGAMTELTVTDLDPFALVGIAVAGTLIPTPFFGGTLAANPPVLVLTHVADAAGELVIPSLDVITPGPLSFYVQAIATDASAPEGVTLSNALRLDYFPWDAKTARNERYKLIADVHGGYQRLYDLQLDPLETTDLFTAGPLTPEAQAAATALRDAINALIAP